MTNRARIICISAVTLALTIVLGFVPFVFLLPVLFTCATRDFKMSVFTALLFGVVSYLYAFMGVTPVAVAFVTYPYIPIVPRVIVGVLAHLAYVVSRKLIKGNSKLSKIVPLVITALVGSLANTGLVTACLMLFAKTAYYGSVTVPMYLTTMLINGAIELAVTCVILPPLTITVGGALGLKGYERVKKPTQPTTSNTVTSNTVTDTSNTVTEEIATEDTVAEDTVTDTSNTVTDDTVADTSNTVTSNTVTEEIATDAQRGATNNDNY